MSDFIDNTKNCATCEIEGCEIGVTINTAQFANLSFSTSGDCNIATLTNGGFNVTTSNLLLNSSPNSLIEITSSVGTIYLFVGALTNTSSQNYEYNFGQVPLGFQNCTVTCSELLAYTGGTVGILSDFNEVAVTPISIKADSCDITENLQEQINILNGATGTLNTATATIYSEEYFGKSSNGVVQNGGRNMDLDRTGTGLWTVTITPPHPDGVDYHPSIQVEEQANNRDAVDAHVIQGTQTANGFDMMLTTGDNGTGADTLVNTPFTIGIDSPVTVVVGVALA